MANKEILKKRWENVDKRLNDFMKQYNKINKRTQDKIQQVFDSIDFTIEDVNKYISPETKERFKRQVEEYEEQGLLTGYFGYNVKNIIKKNKIKNIDMLEILIQGCYMQEMYSVNKFENNLFKEIIVETYNQGIKEVKPKKKHHIIPEVLLATYLSMPNGKGYIWFEYKEAMAEYNASQIKRQVLMNMQQNKQLNINDYEFAHLIETQNKRYINKKKDTKQADKFSGMLDDEIACLVNQTLVKSYYDCGVEKIKILAVEDTKTTKMCQSLDNQVFNIVGKNRFSRYSQEQGGDAQYEVDGLVLGLNLPPINDGFHWCRSTIYPYYERREK